MKCEWKHCVETGDLRCPHCRRHSREDVESVCNPQPIITNGELRLGQKCIHIGQQNGLSQCKSCRGSVRIKTFDCSIHEKCTLQKKLDDIVCCSTCNDYQELS